MVTEIDIKRLKAAALESCCRESYLVLLKKPFCRIGAGARFNEDNDMLLSVFVTVNLCPGNSHINTAALEKVLRLASELKESGYELQCLEGEIHCEKAVSGEEMNPECGRVLALLEKLGIA